MEPEKIRMCPCTIHNQELFYVRFWTCRDGCGVFIGGAVLEHAFLIAFFFFFFLLGGRSWHCSRNSSTERRYCRRHVWNSWPSGLQLQPLPRRRYDWCALRAQSAERRAMRPDHLDLVTNGHNGRMRWRRTWTCQERIALGEIAAAFA